LDDIESLNSTGSFANPKMVAVAAETFFEVAENNLKVVRDVKSLGMTSNSCPSSFCATFCRSMAFGLLLCFSVFAQNGIVVQDIFDRSLNDNGRPASPRPVNASRTGEASRMVPGLF
jgi:hypothetical protein